MQEKQLKKSVFQLKKIYRMLSLITKPQANLINDINKYLNQSKKIAQEDQVKYGINYYIDAITAVMNGSPPPPPRVIPQRQVSQLDPNKNSVGQAKSSNKSDGPQKQSNSNQNNKQVASDLDFQKSSVMSESQKKDRSNNFIQFCKSFEDKLLDYIKINRNLLNEFDTKGNMCIIGSSQPKGNKGLILCALMKYQNQQLVDLLKNKKDYDVFINTQRFPIAIAKSFAQNQELDGIFLHSIAKLPSQLRLGIIKRPNKNITIIKLTTKGKQVLDSCDKIESVHNHHWKQQKCQFFDYYNEEDTVKTLIQEKQMQTKHLKRTSQINVINIVYNGVVTGDKIESKNYNFKFTQKFHTNIIKIKNPYFVLIPNQNNVLNKIAKFDQINDMVAKFKDYKDQRGNSLVVIGAKTSKLIDKAFLGALRQMKNAIACVVKSSLKGNSCLVFKLKQGADPNAIAEIPWDDIEQKKSPLYEKFFTYAKQNIKQYQMPKLTLSDV